jgi:flavin-binding protein dodecin
MSENVYKTVEITGTSSSSIEDAIATALGKAAQSLRNLDWFELASVRGAVADGAVSQYQVTLKLGFRLE